MATPTARRWVVTAACVVVGGAVLAGGSYLAWLRTPPPMPTTVAQAVALVDSPRFTRLPESRRADYLVQVQRLMRDLPEDQRRDAWRQLGPVGQEVWIARAKAFAEASPADRTAMLDAFIAMSEQWRSRRQAQEQKGQRDDRRGEMRQRMEEFMQHGDAQGQAYMQEFFKALRQRRAELGLAK